MRRRLFWTLAVVLCLGVVAAVLLMAGGDQPPFEFLRGRSRVLLNATVAERRRVEEWNTFQAFSFPADFNDTVLDADREVLRNGYRRAGGYIGFGGAPRTRMYEKATRATGRGSKTASLRIVCVLDATRFTAATPLYGPWPEGKDPGWVTVLVYGEGRRDVLSLIRGWFGL